jgi:hypothetical protein
LAISDTGRQLDTAAVESLTGKIRGTVITPQDPTYDEARTVYNAMIDRRPDIIVRCVDTADVISAVRFARENDLKIAIRGGGHNVAGKAMTDGGLVVDLSNMRGVRVDPKARTARVEGGALWGDVDHATHAFGLATPSGIIGTTGVGGLTLGGGFGHLSRRYGLSCDNLIEADIVTANGDLVTASETENPDLFWAIRGGGGNFGIVTSFKFQLHPVENVFAGLVFFPVDNALEIMQQHDDFIKSAPREISAFYSFHNGPPAPFIPEHLHMVPMVTIAVCWNGPMDQAERGVQPIRDFGTPLLDLLQPLPYPALQGMFDGLYPPGLHHYWKADYVHELTPEAMDVHVKYGPTIKGVQTTMHLYPNNGAIQDKPSDAMAFAYRDAMYTTNIVGVGDTAEEMTERIAWVREYWDAQHPYSAEGAYVNFMTDEGEQRVRDAYRGNYPRLVEAKNRWDPTNVFPSNQNIKPTV